MKLRQLSFKNFKSYSNIMTDIDLGDDSSLNLIAGENGTGKTSIAECITYMLYGKLENFTSSDIPNLTNKNFYGKLELECDGHPITIERGLNPSLFKVLIDGNSIDTAGKLNVQAMLEDSYYHIPYSVFLSILIVDMEDVKSLLDMGAYDKRNIIDKICGFTIYNYYTRFVKDDVKDLDTRLTENSAEIRAINSSLEAYERRINDIRANTTSQDELDEMLKQIEEAKKVKAEYDTMLNKLRAAGEQLRTSNVKNAGDYKNLKEKVQMIDKKIALIDGGKCPTCGSSLDTEDFIKEREELVKQKESYQDQMKKIVEMVNSTKKKQTLLESKERDIQDRNSKVNLVGLQSDYMYRNSMKNSSTDSIEEMKKEIGQKLELLNDEKRKLDEDKKLMDFFTMMFSDGGIKKFIANKYVPIINGLMQGMMEYMNLNYVVTFDNNFDATIKQNGVVRKYKTLSKGEKARMDFAAVISFIKFLKLQFGELNLLFLDEVFAHVDVNGVNDMVEILDDLSKELHLNVYLIHHAKLENSLFNSVLHTSKKDGFSHIEYI